MALKTLEWPLLWVNSLPTVVPNGKSQSAARCYFTLAPCGWARRPGRGGGGAMVCFVEGVEDVKLQGGEAVARLVLGRPGREGTVLVAALVLPGPRRRAPGATRASSVDQGVRGTEYDQEENIPPPTAGTHALRLYLTLHRSSIPVLPGLVCSSAYFSGQVHETT